jgi:hypothetical protein
VEHSRAGIFKMVTGLAAIMGRESSLRIVLVFARIAVAGSEGVLQATVQRELGMALPGGGAIPPAVLTRAVQSLSSLGLISRSIDKTDGRHHVLRITDKGSAVLSAEPPAQVSCSVSNTRNSFAHSAL